MSDPAAARFAMIQVTRIFGVACVIAGMLMANGRLFAGAPVWIAYLILAIGLVGIFVIPVKMARKWRTPK
ncbi:hypothetical protein V474_00790 [Novosphingobium barchaimii LL02]|uniref:Uncharacterized protein n=1 Tax=Novosphingobium barchaimii LL02 TaxID=1114963 RepID=A0A0J7YA84_9SPHN|nr:hypothetical protein [Novosphingobium barchaimii]KMS60253.1 hypothetical protein V474_00790 [Novosphingobium barchaimii LL02]